MKSINDNNSNNVKLVAVVRVSKEDLAQGYGPAIQKAEIIADSVSNGYKLIATRQIVEPATIDLQERELFKQVFAEAIKLKKSSQCDGLCFSRCDRLSRQFDGAIQTALDCRRQGLTLRFIRENQWLYPDDPPINFVMFVIQAMGVHTQTSVSLANLKAGQHRAAEAGKLPAGVGPGLLGYTLVGKQFKPNSFIGVCDEVLEQGYQGQTINQITRSLQGRGVRTPLGRVITRSTVALILRKARRYAGIWDWGGHQITGLIPPRISVEKAEAILANLKRNREYSFGFGKRKWLTGRVICGLCWTKYRLRGQGSCECRRASKLEASSPCPSPRIRWQKLSQRVWDLLLANLMHLDIVRLVLEKRRAEWEQEKANIEAQIQKIQEQVDGLHRRRRLYSWQHSEGIIGDREVLDACRGIQTQAALLEKQLGNLRRFLDQPEPPDPATIEEWVKLWPTTLATHYQNVSDEIKCKFAEVFDLTVTIFPGHIPRSYRLQLTANIPLEIEGIKESPNSLDIVLPSPR
jgi:DNA invertase Pin-like site-specific DNA recombinase